MEAETITAIGSVKVRPSAARLDFCSVNSISNKCRLMSNSIAVHDIDLCALTKT